MLESYVPSVITSAIPLYEKYENKEDVLKHIDKFNPQKNADATELHNTIRQFWEA
jgi:Tfp pilus assembly major pilin PilA